MDAIKIDNLKIYAYHGVLPEENAVGQFFYINAVLYTDTRKAGLEDDLSFSTHYGDVCQFMNQFVEENTFQLIETVAERLAQAILLKFERIQQLDLEIRKPSAPIGLPLQSVSVKINRGWHKAYVAFGSNMGNREEHIKKAIEKIKNDYNCKIGKISDVIYTKPYGNTDQGDFLNGVLEMDTLYNPEELLEVLNKIETAAGRERKVHWGPRTLDLDIIFYDKLIYDSENLVIPHIDMHNRSFVLEPMAQIAPYYRHPVLKQTMGELSAKLK